MFNLMRKTASTREHELNAFNSWIRAFKRKASGNSTKVPKQRTKVMLNGCILVEMFPDEYTRFQYFLNIESTTKLHNDHITGGYSFNYKMILIDIMNLVSYRQYKITINPQLGWQSQNKTTDIYIYNNDENLYLTVQTDIAELQKLVKGIQFFKSNDPMVQILFPGYSQISFLNMLFQFINLTDDMLTKSRATYKKKDLLRVGMCNVWLNDVVINDYFNLIKERSNNSIHVFDTFFWSRLTAREFYTPIVKDKITKIDFFSYKKLLFPINFTNHWVLFIVNLEKRRLEYYDSIESSCISNFSKKMEVGAYFITNAFMLLRPNDDVETYINTWRVYNGNSPIQDNSDDCGVFVCTNANLVSKDQQLNYSAEHINLLRQKIFQECLDGALKSESVSQE